MNRIHPGLPPSKRRQPGADWRNKVRLWARLQVHFHRHCGNDAPTIRTKVISAAREALSEAPGVEMIKPMKTPRLDGKGLQDDYRVSAAGMFRIPLAEFDVNWSDLVTAESIMAVVIETLDEELGSESVRT